MNIVEAKQTIQTKLKNQYELIEINAIIDLIFEEVLNLSKLDILTNGDKKISESDKRLLEAIVERLRKNEPIQYILGSTEFYNIQVKVNSSTLIPRQETEELVDWIIKNNKITAPKILDIGTGSGCIPISLSKNIKNAEVWSFDISLEALKTAQENSKWNKVEVNFRQVDILNYKNYNLQNKYDIIVSNPPYVCEKERKLMQKNVLDYEPETALFVDDYNPLVFYRTICEYAQEKLNTNGILYFEINEAYGVEMIELLEEFGFEDIELKKDLNNKHRMIKGVRADG